MDVRRRQERARIVVTGRVQGVGFRWFVTEETRWLGLVGMVANREDGSVLIEAEGRRDALTRLVGRVAVGPPAARVDSLDVKWGERQGTFSDFAIVR